MQKKNKARFFDLLEDLSEVFNRPITERLFELYFAALEDYRISEIAEAVKLILKKEDFFPSPHRIAEYVRDLRVAKRSIEPSADDLTMERLKRLSEEAGSPEEAEKWIKKIKTILDRKEVSNESSEHKSR